MAPSRHRTYLLLAFLIMAAAPGRADVTSEREMTALGEEPTPLLALPLGEAPGATFVITAEEIERTGAANIFDLLRRVPGVDIRYTPMGGHISIRSTGSSPFSEEILLLIDGSPYNSPDKGGFPGHPNYAGFFPLERIARIEIVRGPISALYGANAFGGVINIVSKKAADTVHDRVEGAAAGLTLRAGSRGIFERFARFAFVQKGFDATVDLGAADGETPVLVNGDAEHSRNHVYVALRRGNLWGSVLHQESRHGPLDFEGTTTRTARNNVNIVDAHYERKVGPVILRGSATLNRYRGTTCGVCHNARTGPPDDSQTTEIGDEREVDQRIRVAMRGDTTPTDSQDLTFGFEAARDSVERDVVRLDEVEEKVDGGGVYLQHQWHPGGRKLHVVTGLRLDYLESLGGVSQPRIALVAEPNENLVLRASWSRAYRNPTWNERFRRQRFDPADLAPGLILVFQGNPQLDREQVDAAEAGFSWRPFERVVIRTDLYSNRIADFINLGESQFVFGSPSEIRVVYENREDTFTVRGGEVTLLARPVTTVSVTAGYAYRKLSLGRDDPDAAYAPHSRVTLAAAWMPGRWAFDLSASHSSSYTVSSPGVFGLRPQPSYQLYDAAARYHVPTTWGRLELGLVGRNLTDAHPRETFVGPDIDTRLRGRSYAAEIRMDF